jgi:hypothetical protein
MAGLAAVVELEDCSPVSRPRGLDLCGQPADLTLDRKP